MCGRFTLRTRLTLLVQLFRMQMHDELVPRYNIAPTQQVLACRQTADGSREGVSLRWGLIPSWAKEEKIGSSLINARAETVAEKPSFRTAFKRRRCLVLADGYYEWKAGTPKQPHFIHMADDRPFALAALWESWRGPKEAPLAEPLETCTLITTTANELTAKVHDRMPVILPPEEYDYWLDPAFEGTDKLLSLLKPYPSDEMALYPVSTYVNNARNEGERALQPA